VEEISGSCLTIFWEHQKPEKPNEHERNPHQEIERQVANIEDELKILKRGIKDGYASECTSLNIAQYTTRLAIAIGGLR